MRKSAQNKPVVSSRHSIMLLLACMMSFILISSAVAVSSAELDKPPTVSMVPESFAALAKQSSPAVVNISTVKTVKNGGQVFRHYFGMPQGPMAPNNPFNQFFKNFFNNIPQQQLKETSLGSGFIYDKSGYIITNTHVIDDSDQIKVKLKDNKEYDAKVIGKDAVTDLALLKINAKEDLPTLPLGDSGKMQVGDWVIAIGNPFGLSDTVTAGIISAKGRVIGEGPYDDFIQTDASINPGNSGGPLINMEGQVVGINTAIIAGGGGGIGFAIPIDMVKKVIPQLKEHGEVIRGWLGVAIQDLDTQLKSYYNVKSGVLVTEVFPDNPAEKAGIKANDIILSVNGADVNSSRDLSMLIAGLPVGSKAEIKINRGGQILTKEVTISQRKESEVAALAGQPEAPAQSPLGLQVSNITPEIEQQLQLKNTEGVVVLNVAPDSKADQAGFGKGDIIRQINHKSVKDISDYDKIIDGVKSGGTLEFLVQNVNGGFGVIKLTK